MKEEILAAITTYSNQWDLPEMVRLLAKLNGRYPEVAPTINRGLGGGIDLQHAYLSQAEALLLEPGTTTVKVITHILRLGPEGHRIPERYRIENFLEDNENGNRDRLEAIKMRHRQVDPHFEIVTFHLEHNDYSIDLYFFVAEHQA